MGLFKSAAILITVLGLLGCASKSIRISPELLQPYSEEENAKEEFEAPYVAAYEKGPYRLWFVAAAHVANSDNPTCRTIRKAFQELTPTFLIVEGTSYSQVNDPTQISYAKKCEQTQYANCGEDACAINEALRRGVNFNYGEPLDVSIKDAMIAEGYSDHDLIFFYALRQVPQLKRRAVTKESMIRDQLSKKLPLYSQRLQTNATLSLQEFEKAYRAKFDSPIDYGKIDTDTVSPRVDGNLSWANKFSSKLGLVRERFLTSMIEKRLNEYGTVLVVYGQGHLVKQRKALKQAMGNPNDSKLF